MGHPDSVTASIPVIDISPRNPHASHQLLDAASRYGFVFVENNDAGIDPADIAHMFDLSREFFASPVDVKEEVSIRTNTAGKNLGWLSRGTETLDPRNQKRADVKEALNIGEPKQNTFTQPIPKPLQPHINTLITFQQSCHALCSRILRHFATALEIPPDWFTSRHTSFQDPSSSVFRLLYYPRAGDVEDGVDIRAGAHSDYGSITLLFQLPGQPGLEILTPGGEWAAVPVDPSGSFSDAAGGINGHGKKALPILVNIGDLLAYWTNDLLKSTVHRVIFPPDSERGGQDRYSIAYFCHPLDDAELIPVPSKMVQDRAKATSNVNGKVITAKDHLNERLAATYHIKS